MLTWFVLFTTGKTCPLYAGPKNGALACNTIASDIVCVVMCNSGFDFEFNPPMLYYCVEGEWAFYSLSSYSYPQHLPWPDCSSKLTSLLIKTISRTKAPSSRIRIFFNPNFFFPDTASVHTHPANFTANSPDMLKSRVEKSKSSTNPMT